MARRTCKICGADVGSAEFSTCGRHACQRAAFGPGADDGDDRQPTRCVHCLQVGQGNPCPQCRALIEDIDQPVPRPQAPPVGPAPETEQARRDRFHAARVACVRASFERGRRCLLARALDAADQSWAVPQPR